MSKTLKILFLGTPDFAAFSLKKLVESGYNIVGVVTAPDRPAGRGQKPKESAVKIYAREAGLTVFQPERLRDEEFLAQLRALEPDLGIVIAFRMLPEVVWSLPRLGTFNLHASLLPQYRGAAPINWAIINGETMTGATTFMIGAEIDKGNILGRVEMPILPNDNAGTMHDKLMTAGAELVVETVEKIAVGTARALPQSEVEAEKLKPAPKIFKDDCRVDWSQNGKKIVDFIRGLSPYPTAFSNGEWRMENGELSEPISLKLFDGAFEKAAHDLTPGTADLSSKNVLRVACPDGWICITELQPAGGRRMSAKEFLNGLKNSLSTFN